MGEVPISSLVVKDAHGNYIRLTGEKRDPDFEDADEPQIGGVISHFNARNLKFDGYLTIQKFDDWIAITSFRRNGQVEEELIKESQVIGFVIDPDDFVRDPHEQGRPD